MDTLGRFLQEFWRLSEEMAPYLLIGFLAAALLRAFIDESFVRRHLGQRGWFQTVKAALIGVPLPLCSCGVIPVAASLRRQGASAGAVTSFTASTPQTGVDSIFATAALLNWPFALVRVVVAFVNGIVAGTLVDRFANQSFAASGPSTPPKACGCGCGSEKEPAPVASASCGCGAGAAEVPAPRTKSCCGEAPDVSAPPSSSDGCCCSTAEKVQPAMAASCCGGESAASADSASGEEGKSCCSSASMERAESTRGCCASSPADETTAPVSRLGAGFRFGFFTLPGDIGKALILGLVLAALLGVLLPPDLGATGWTQGILAYLATTAIAVPIYVCSTGSIPMAYALVHAGFSPGAALVFLIAGPATNTATVSALWKMIGTRAVVIYLASLVVIAWISGGLLDSFGGTMEFRGGHMHAATTAWWKTLSAVVLYAILLLPSWINLKTALRRS